MKRPGARPSRAGPESFMWRGGASGGQRALQVGKGAAPGQKRKRPRPSLPGPLSDACAETRGERKSPQTRLPLTRGAHPLRTYQRTTLRAGAGTGRSLVNVNDPAPLPAAGAGISVRRRCAGEGKTARTAVKAGHPHSLLGFDVFLPLSRSGACDRLLSSWSCELRLPPNAPLAWDGTPPRAERQAMGGMTRSPKVGNPQGISGPWRGS